MTAPVRTDAGERVVAGLDLGGTKMLAILMDERARVRARIRRATPQRGNDAVCEAILAMIGELLQAGRDSDRMPAGIAIGAPGYVHAESGTIVDASNLGVQDLPLGRIVAETFGLPTLLVHDVKAAALGEARFGAAAGWGHVAFLNVGTGVSVGLVLGGQLFSGAAGRAGEIGHVRMQRDGPLCICGQHGCLEALTSGPALVRQAQAIVAHQPDSAVLRLAGGVVEAITPEVVAEAAQLGDGVALALIHRAADYLGMAIAGLLNVLDLERVIVGGGLSQMGELFLSPIRAATHRYALPAYQGVVPILPPALGTEAGAIGAAAAVLDQR